MTEALHLFATLVRVAGAILGCALGGGVIYVVGLCLNDEGFRCYLRRGGPFYRSRL